MTHAAMPLATVCVNFRQYIMFHARRFFDNEFSGNQYPMIDPKGNKVMLHLAASSAVLPVPARLIRPNLPGSTAGVSLPAMVVPDPNQSYI